MTFGSSPRVRGTHCHGPRVAAEGRFIPARAGNTWVNPICACLQPVHPRACGGTLLWLRQGQPTRRFIPARAGNTAADRFGVNRYSVHPRACGEHAGIPTSLRRYAGSSPRVRGTLQLAVNIVVDNRFIPARAGNTGPQTIQPTAKTVHPRACGEHRARARPSLIGDRFIPARAGNTLARPVTMGVSSVHPRACGEHSARRRTASNTSWFIPARAGNTHSV